MHMFKNLPPQSYFKNKRVLVRVDWNVTLESGKIQDDFRIQRSLQTIEYISKTARSVLIVSHLGSPTPGDTQPSLAPVAQRASRLLKRPVYFLSGALSEIAVAFLAVPDHAVACMENIKFYKGEKENDARFAKQLAGFADIYIDDAFGEVHRDVASIAGVPKFLPHYAGFLMQEELKHLDALMKKPKYPFVVVLGGAKLETKLPVVKKFLKQADAVLLGGGIANTVLAAGGVKIGSSLFEKEFLPEAKKYLDEDSLFVPIDFLVATSKDAKKSAVKAGDIDQREWILDIGPDTQALYAEILKRARTIFWNGPMGYFENRVFAHGTQTIANALKKNKTARIVIGGGDTLAFLRNASTKHQAPSTKNIFISTGGGSMLYYLAGKKLPGIEVLKK